MENSIFCIVPICLNNSLNSIRTLHSFKFAKAHPLSFNELIPYFSVFAYEIKRETPLFREKPQLNGKPLFSLLFNFSVNIHCRKNKVFH